MRTLTLWTLTALALTMAGCKKDEAGDTPKPQPVALPKPEPAPEPDPPPPPPEPEAKTDKREPIGVPECDRYLAKYSACLEEKVPVGTRAAMEKQLQVTWEEWQKAAKQPGGKAQLARACRTAFDAMTASMKTFGCEW